uniref:C2H2-type domain-containing protein n=1 Tax=Octopus bimaculoides TaxID=37653 RepID=A0A0L8IFT4_OCTBM
MLFDCGHAGAPPLVEQIDTRTYSFNVLTCRCPTRLMMEETEKRWRSADHKGANTCETNRIAAAEDCRQARRNRANNPVAGAILPCPHCQRLFRVQIGLTSHLWTHKTSPPSPQDD